jgi:hypothetical protein
MTYWRFPLYEFHHKIWHLKHFYVYGPIQGKERVLTWDLMKSDPLQEISYFEVHSSR